MIEDGGGHRGPPPKTVRSRSAARILIKRSWQVNAGGEA
jgi:hypothetical protein